MPTASGARVVVIGCCGELARLEGAEDGAASSLPCAGLAWRGGLWGGKAAAGGNGCGGAAEAAAAAAIAAMTCLVSWEW